VASIMHFRDAVVIGGDRACGGGVPEVHDRRRGWWRPQVRTASARKRSASS
jgi:hypothetical protein